MLVAETADGVRCQAAFADRQAHYECPACRDVLILKQGHIVVHHFAHPPNSICDFGCGETYAHMTAKKLFHERLGAKGFWSDVEFPLPGIARRADVVAKTPDNQMYAVELQHTPISAVELMTRINDYWTAGIAQLWLPFIRDEVRKNLELKDCDGCSANYYCEFEGEAGTLDMERWLLDARPLKIASPNWTWFWDSKLCKLWQIESKPLTRVRQGWDEDAHCSYDAYEVTLKNRRLWRAHGPFALADVSFTVGGAMMRLNRQYAARGKWLDLRAPYKAGTWIRHRFASAPDFTAS